MPQNATHFQEEVTEFDLFLSHNAHEKKIVARIAERLLDEFSIRCWIDEWDLPGGTEWAAAIDRALRQCRAAAIVLGPAGWGDSHLLEARVALEIARQKPEFIVIPVLLPGATADAMAVVGEIFSAKHRIKLTGDDSLRQLAFAVNGEAHGPPVMTPFVIRRDAHRWRASGDDRGLLYRGVELQKAQQLAMSGDLDDEALTFLTASANEEKRTYERERTRSRRIIATLTAMVTALIAATYFAYAERTAAKREAARAVAQQLVANRMRRVADTRLQQVTAQNQRASAANLLEISQRLYNDEPWTALRFAAEAMVRAPRTDQALAARALQTLRDMVAAGRLSRIAVSAEKPIAVPDSDFFIVNEAISAILRRRFDGTVAARLPLKVEGVVNPAKGERVPYFLVKYGYQQQELRRKRDGSVVSEFSVESLARVAPSLTRMEYFGGVAELRCDERDTISVELPKDAKVEVSGDRRMFAVAAKSQAGVALFDSRCRRIALPKDTTAAIFDERSDRYVVLRQGSRGELRSTMTDTIVELRGEVNAAQFVGDRLFVTYAAGTSEMCDRDGHVVMSWPDVVRVEAVPGTSDARVTQRSGATALLDVRTDQRKTADIVMGDTAYTTRNVGAQKYFVEERFARPGVLYDILSTATREKALTTTALGQSPGTSWVVAVQGEHPLLFNLADGRQVPMAKAGFKRVPLHTMNSVVPDHPSISLFAWRDVPVMVVSSLPSEVRRVSDGSLVATMPARCEYPTLSPDSASFAVDCEHVMHEYADGGQLVRADATIHSAHSGRMIASLTSFGRDVQFTRHGTMAFSSTAAMYHLRGGGLFRGRSLQISDSREWLALQYGTTRSELWQDDGPRSLAGPVAALPDGAVLIGADTSGRRVVIWEPNGATLLLAADFLAARRRHPDTTPEGTLRDACTLIKSFSPALPAVDRFSLGEPLRACGDARNSPAVTTPARATRR